MSTGIITGGTVWRRGLVDLTREQFCADEIVSAGVAVPRTAVCTWRRLREEYEVLRCRVQENLGDSWVELAGHASVGTALSSSPKGNVGSSCESDDLTKPA